MVMMPGDDVLSEPVAWRVEVFTGAGRRRRWSAEAKAQIVAESYATSVGEVADRYGLAKTQLFTWRRDARDAGPSEPIFASVVLEVRPRRRRSNEVRPSQRRVDAPGRAASSWRSTACRCASSVGPRPGRWRR